MYPMKTARLTRIALFVFTVPFLDAALGYGIEVALARTPQSEAS
jgi:hypothetical protein